ncbi:MAG: hypothetical protein ABIQ89_03420 [Candidatus Saccharimonadales bacterium]
MKQLDQRGHMDMLLIPLILVAILFVAAGSFGIWAYMSRQDYKDNSDAKVDAAVVVAEQKTSTAKDVEFLEKEKQPLVSYNGPAPYGSLKVSYPKTWSAYVAEKANGSTPVDAYFHPKFVPAQTPDVSYALRVQISDTSFASVVKTFDNAVKSGKVKASAYVPANAPNVTGVRFDGEIASKKQGSMIIVPIRDKSLKIWTESQDFVKDFNENILPNYTFSQ